MRWSKANWSVQVVSSEAVKPQTALRFTISTSFVIYWQVKPLNAGIKRLSSFWAAVRSALPLRLRMGSVEEGGLGAGKNFAKQNCSSLRAVRFH
jgi:hypothetical protein